MRRSLATACALWLASSMMSARADDRPNLVLMIADDMAWDDCGAYGHPSIRTPNIDRLAREGLRFDRAFLTCSSCSPSRSSMITGRYPHSTDAEELHWPLPAAQVTFVEKLKGAGYWTAAAGKWHLGEAVKNRFDVVHEGGSAAYQLPTGPEAAKSKNRMGNGGAAGAESGCSQWVPTLRERPRDKPFFTWLAAFDPHRDYRNDTLAEPHRREDVRVPPYLPDVPEVRDDLARYYDEITRLDSFVGAVLDELKAQGVVDNTLVLFLSDNGRPFPRCKTTVYDSGVRTPLIVRWPGHVRPGSTTDGLVSSVDIAPTFLELAGVTIPETVQGRSFADILADPSATTRRFVFAEHNWHDFADFSRAVRSERYKYIRNFYPDLSGSPPADAVRSPTFVAMRTLRDAGKLTPAQLNPFVVPRPTEELYDLQADPDELQNLVGDPAYARTLEGLRRELTSWREETDDRLPTTRSADEFDRETGDPLPNRVRPRPGKRALHQGDRPAADPGD